jgi:hypothetical protein
VAPFDELVGQAHTRRPIQRRRMSQHATLVGAASVYAPGPRSRYARARCSRFLNGRLLPLLAGFCALEPRHHYMRDELTRRFRPIVITFLNGRVRRRPKVNTIALDVSYKSISHFQFFNYIFNIISISLTLQTPTPYHAEVPPNRKTVITFVHG